MAQCLDGYSSRFASDHMIKRLALIGLYNQAQELISRWQLVKTLDILSEHVNLPKEEPWGFHPIAEAELIPIQTARLGSQAGN